MKLVQEKALRKGMYGAHQQMQCRDVYVVVEHVQSEEAKLNTMLRWSRRG